jgi:hypothetical protein
MKHSRYQQRERFPPEEQAQTPGAEHDERPHSAHDRPYESDGSCADSKCADRAQGERDDHPRVDELGSTRVGSDDTLRSERPKQPGKRTDNRRANRGTFYPIASCLRVFVAKTGRQRGTSVRVPMAPELICIRSIRIGR